MKSSNRNPFIDQFKGILIFFVVLGHFAVHLQEFSPIWGGVSNFIYSFHMPAFILLSGYLSKGVTTQRIKEIDTLIYPYIVFQILNFIYTYFTGFGHGTLNIYSPAYLNWYIMALFFWRLFLPYFQKMKRWLVAVVLLGLWFTSGYGVSNGFLSFYRVFYFFPFFMIGYYIEDLEVLLCKLSRLKAIPYIVFLLITTVLVVLSCHPQFNMLVHDAFAPDFGYKSLWSVVYKVVGCLIQLVMTFCMMIICSNIRALPKGLNKWGKQSMSIYITHGFVTLTLVPLVITKLGAPVGLIVSIFLSLALCWILLREAIVKFLGPLLDMGKMCNLLKIKVYN